MIPLLSSLVMRQAFVNIIFFTLHLFQPFSNYDYSVPQQVILTEHFANCYICTYSHNGYISNILLHPPLFLLLLPLLHFLLPQNIHTHSDKYVILHVYQVIELMGISMCCLFLFILLPNG